MKIGLVTDTHFGIRNDSVNFLDYFEKFYSKHFFPHLKEQGIDTIIHLGDIVDRRKYINYVTLRRMKEMFIDKCTEEGIELHVIVGNHDVPYKNTNDVNSMRELFDKSNVNYYSEPTDLKFDGHDIHHHALDKQSKLCRCDSVYERHPSSSVVWSPRDCWLSDGSR